MTEQEMFKLFEKSGFKFGSLVDIEDNYAACYRQFKALEDGFDCKIKMPTLIYHPEFSQMVDQLIKIEKELDALDTMLNEEDSSDIVIETYFKLIELDLKTIKAMIEEYKFHKKIVRIIDRTKIKFPNKKEKGKDV